MASLSHKMIKGHKYYYARVCKRVNGKPKIVETHYLGTVDKICLLYTSPSPRDRQKSRMPSSA